ncbi:MAG: hypothetical protein Ta2A_11170 [Treponemataceae bacterium]|nr:MAG: hypothetical protein Ta2A_11170 [Treponemataceae bacterium]
MSVISKQSSQAVFDDANLTSTTTGLSASMTMNQIGLALTSATKYKGKVATEAALPTSGQANGDMWVVQTYTPTGSYAWAIWDTNLATPAWDFIIDPAVQVDGTSVIYNGSGQLAVGDIDDSNVADDALSIAKINGLQSALNNLLPAGIASDMGKALILVSTSPDTYAWGEAGKVDAALFDGVQINPTNKVLNFQAIQDYIDAETTRATAAEGVNAAAISAEASRAAGAESAIAINLGNHEVDNTSPHSHALLITIADFRALSQADKDNGNYDVIWEYDGVTDDDIAWMRAICGRAHYPEEVPTKEENDVAYVHQILDPLATFDFTALAAFVPFRGAVAIGRANSSTVGLPSGASGGTVTIVHNTDDTLTVNLLDTANAQTYTAIGSSGLPSWNGTIRASITNGKLVSNSNHLYIQNGMLTGFIQHNNSTPSINVGDVIFTINGYNITDGSGFWYGFTAANTPAFTLNNNGNNIQARAVESGNFGTYIYTSPLFERVKKM